LQVAPRTYRAWKSSEACARARSDAALLDMLLHVRTGNEGRPLPEVLYGRRKMTAWLARNGFPDVSKHTVDRLMRDEGMNGLVRGRSTKTTVPAKSGGVRAGDLLNRVFTSPHPNHAWVTDFTYVPTWCGFVYVAFAIDLYSRAIVGWSASTTKDVSFVEQCLQMALWRRDHTSRPVPAGMIHHSDAGSQYTSVRFTETLALEGLSASIGSVGDAYDNAAAETVFGLFKNEAVAAASPFRTGPLRHLADVEALTLNYVHWYNNDRLHSELDYLTPEEYEQLFYALPTASPSGDAANKKTA
jgi:putative transposase